MAISCALPSHPVVVSVCTSEPDGSTRKRANMIADETQVPRLVSSSSNPLRDHAALSLRAALHLDHLPITFQRAPASSPALARLFGS